MDTLLADTPSLDSPAQPKAAAWRDRGQRIVQLGGRLLDLLGARRDLPPHLRDIRFSDPDGLAFAAKNVERLAIESGMDSDALKGIRTLTQQIGETYHGAKVRPWSLRKAAVAQAYRELIGARVHLPDGTAVLDEHGIPVHQQAPGVPSQLYREVAAVAEQAAQLRQCRMSQ